jgi:hypothetical protein
MSLVRPLLKSSNMPPYTWDFAVEYAQTLLNCTPQALTWETPTFFGSRCYAKIHGQFDTLHDRAEEMRFLGMVPHDDVTFYHVCVSPTSPPPRLTLTWW